MTATQRILKARQALATLTPLKMDCGKLCGAACCHSDEEGKGGMVLFPGEEALYPATGPDHALLTPCPTFPGQFLYTCDGTCLRSARPLACRIFPLTPRIREGKLALEMDVRAWPVCPLMEQGLRALSQPFVQAVRAVMEDLFADAACRAYFEALSRHLDAYEHF